MKKRKNRESVIKESMYDERWQLFRRFPAPLAAQLAAGILENAQIPTYRLDSTVSLYMRGRGTSLLYVRACDMDRAERILAELDQGEPLSEEELAEEALKYKAPEDGGE